MHTSSTIVLVLAVFAASLVEMVEALTIVVAAGVSRGWRSALEGAAAAALVLGVFVVAVGVPLIRYIPLDALRVIVGALLLVLGLSWLRKAILRSSGHKAPHDEDLIYAETVAELGAGAEARRRRRRRRRPEVQRDGVGFAVAFKGVFLEGTEVVLDRHQSGCGTTPTRPRRAGGGAAFVLVAIVGLVVARQLSEVPENTIKTVVGVMLTSFGVFWVGEGAGVHWPGDDLAIPVLVGFFVVMYFGYTALLRTRFPAPAVETETAASVTGVVVRTVRAFGHFWWDFLVGDTPELALATGVIVAVAFALAGSTIAGAIALPLLAAGFLLVSTLRGRREAPGSN